MKEPKDLRIKIGTKEEAFWFLEIKQLKDKMKAFETELKVAKVMLLAFNIELKKAERRR